MKKLILWSALLLLCSCEPKSAQVKNKLIDLLEEYTNTLDNAKSQEEITFLKKEFERKGEMLEDEINKLQESGDYSLKDIQDIMQDEELEEVAKRAKKQNMMLIIDVKNS